MSDPSAFGFGQFVPGFDFLQNLSKTASQAQPAAAGGIPGMASWAAPTLSIEEIDKRIQELKSVLFWLEQNTTALKATIQAMEVQKMTLTTLQSMNVNMADLAKAFTAKPPAAEPAQPSSSGATANNAAAVKSSLFTPKTSPDAVVEPAAETQAEPQAPADASAAEPVSDAAKPAVDPMQWWGALTQQFQGIAAAALKDVAGEAMKAGMAAKAAKPAQPEKAPAGRKAAVKTAKASVSSSRAKPQSKAVAGAAQPAAARKSASAAPAKTVRQKAKPTPRQSAAK
ncbi:PhaM family polyhydroxyalkanoate granule multifunctional regulatory protein [Limnohabitans sp. Rim47]|uniref:PhaM family polyhydroxyalkanoate granule multifunctional regulatory protein n=1 Tax=Limnohabitans sp. Rim47 TaxID=1100721 RepID=UPI0002DF163D|nr:PhaM family polyhydroxyalkanoate granule multifunctional regulatory protein [Limnohabitans sp. Rim47]